eukprot:TRINITY_DN943_c0_g1_i1.p1 TRINITY_DN943_c0_g1~~TRINITY_DN943_c0_g1_i1.p1  ORF type:complete len:893 (+),score=216.65 TRINITY_DN943_c0_g1_i1:95-2680(+)
MGSGASSKCSDEQALGLLLAIAELGDGRTHGSAIPDGGTVRVTELAEFLRVGIKAHDDCPAMPDAVVSLISGTQGTVVQSKGNLVQIRHTVGVIWVPRMCVDWHAKERVRITSDAALLKMLVQASMIVQPGLVSWSPGMEEIAGLDCDILEREGPLVKLSPFPAFPDQVIFLPAAAVDPVPDRCRKGLYPGQKVRAVKRQLDAVPSLKQVFGADGSNLATVLGADNKGDPFIGFFLITGEYATCTLPRALVVPLLQQGTEVQLSPEGLQHEGVRSFLKPGATGLVCGFDDDGDPKVVVKGPSVAYVSQVFVVPVQDDSAPSVSKDWAVGTRVLVDPKVSTPTHDWGGVSPGDVGFISVSRGNDKYEIHFAQNRKWVGVGAELLEANFTGGSCGECQSKLVDATARSQSWICDQCKRSFKGPGTERWLCSQGCDYDQCAICKKVPPKDSLVGRRVRCGDVQALRAAFEAHPALEFDARVLVVADEEGTVKEDDRSDDTLLVNLHRLSVRARLPFSAVSVIDKGPPVQRRGYAPVKPRDDTPHSDPGRPPRPPGGESVVDIDPKYFACDGPHKWTRMKTLGKGGFGTVALALLQHKAMNVAVKIIELGGAPDQKSREDFEKEFQLMKRLTHPNIVAYLGHYFDTAKDELHIFLEFVAGGSVSDRVREFMQMGKRMPDSVIRHYVKQVLLGLEYLHTESGEKPVVAHRDIKGANLLLTTSGDVKLADFGCSKMIGKARGVGDMQTDIMQTAVDAKTMVGTPIWMAPEIITGQSRGQAYGEKCDIWSLGCTIVEMHGRMPWSHVQAESMWGLLMAIVQAPGGPTNIPSDVPAQLKKFLNQCFVRNVQNRPSAAELLQHEYITFED